MSKPRVYISTRGDKYVQFWQLIPWLERYYTNTEKEFDPFPTEKWMIDNGWFPIVVVSLYLAFCYFGTQYMSSRTAFNLKYPLAIWNLFLALFSAYGTIRTAPHLLYLLFYDSFESTVCETPVKGYGMGATGLACQLFVLSKFPELIDTVFIVLKKRPLIFLHWYHHVTVLLYCWHSYVTEAGYCFYFITMNYAVHSVMYFYYFLQTMKLVPKWFPTWLITVFQISQMFVGIFITGCAIYFFYFGGREFPPRTCHNQESNMVAASIMYSSYAALFIAFAFERFLFPAPPAPLSRQTRTTSSATKIA